MTNRRSVRSLRWQVHKLDKRTGCPAATDQELIYYNREIPPEGHLFTAQVAERAGYSQDHITATIPEWQRYCRRFKRTTRIRRDKWGQWIFPEPEVRAFVAFVKTSASTQNVQARRAQGRHP